jgi:release factor glutamine methyltransferase
MPEASPGAAPPSPPETLSGAIRRLAVCFREAGLATPELDARLLVLEAQGISQEAFMLDPARPLSAAARQRLAEWQARRLAREPVSRIRGRRDFWGRSFALNPATLDPRPETETLIEAALAIIDEEGGREAPLRLLDLGAGTGCILLSLLAELPRTWGVGVDIAPEAASLAARNARQLGLGERAAFVCGDWTAPICGAFHYVLANPPYIRRQDIAGLEPEVSRYDPHHALDGGEDGYDAYRRIARGALAQTAPGGWLIAETGAGQAPYVADLFQQSGWGAGGTAPRRYRDLLNHDRVVAVRKHK